MSVVFAIYLSATSTGLNVMTQIFEQKGYDVLGNISIFTIFTFGMIGNFVCILYIRKLKYRYSFAIHSLGYLLFLLSGLIVCHCEYSEDGICNKSVIYTITIISSAISGFTSSGLFVTQNDYVAQLSKQSNKAGLYYGVAWAILQLCQVIGSLYSAFVIVQIKQFYFYLLMIVVATIGCVLFLLIPQPQKQNQIYIQEQEISEIEKLTPITVLKTMKEFRVKCMVLPMMLTGCLLSYQWNVLHYLIENSIDTNQSDEQITKQTLIVMMVLGCCEVLGGLLIGVLNSRIPKYTSQVLQLHLFTIALIIAIINSYEMKYGLCFLIAIIWGLVDCSTTSTLLALIAEDWNDQIEYFGLFNFLQCVGGMISTIVSIILSNYSYEWSILYLLLIVASCKVSLSCYQKLYINK